MQKHPDEIIVEAEKLQQLCSTLYQKVGVPKEDADAIAKVQVETDLRGVHSHGTRALPSYVRRIMEGFIKPRPEIQIVRETPAMALMDGDRGMGHVAAMRAMQLAIEKAKTMGIGAVGVRNSHHFGPAAAYAMMALEHEMIGFATTSTGGASVAAYGSKQAAVGNNPLAWAIPTKTEPPIVLDMACGVSAWGRIGTMRLYGQKLSPGWALDENGEPTDDPAKARILLPAGGPKGYGLAFVCSTLAGALVGGRMPIHKERLSPKHATEHFLMALNVEAFVPFDEFVAEVEASIRDIRKTKPAEGFDRVYLPGEIEWLKSQEWRKTGIPLHKEHLRGIANIAKELGVPVFWE